jgi:hypothetical protein
LVTFSQSKALFLSNYYISKITNNPDYLIQNSVAINQLLQFMHHNTSLSENYNLLITTILNNTPKDLLNAYFDISGNNYKDLEDSMKNGEIYIFYSNPQDSNNPQGGAVFINFDKILKQEITDDDFANVYFFQKLDRKPSTPPSNSHASPYNPLGSILNFITPNAPDAPDPPTESYYELDTSGASFAEQYKKYPILERLFLEFQSNKKTSSLINCLGLPHEYKIHFIKALENRTYSYDMVGIEQQEKLIEVFQMHIKPPHSIGENGIENITIGISDVHFENLCNAYGVSSSSSKEKASFCLALAAMFSRYSSSSIFGQHDDSPIALRNYALALLNKANELDDTLIEVKILKDWREKFLGLKNDNSECTAVLSDCIKDYIQTKSCGNKWILATFPTAWS